MKPRLFTASTTLADTDLLPFIKDLGSSTWGERHITKANLLVTLGVPTVSDYTQNQSALVGLTGGGATKLDGLTTVGVAVGKLVAVTISGVTYFYQLVAGTTAEASPSIIRPDDYAGGSNEKVWKLSALTLPGNPANALDAAPKQYVDAGDALLLPLAGGTVTGALTVQAALSAYQLTLPASTLTYGATTDIDFAGRAYQIVALTGNVTFTFSNLAADRSVTLEIQADGTLRTTAFPAGVRVIGAALPANVAANKIAIITFRSNGTTAANVRAAYSVEA